MSSDHDFLTERLSAHAADVALRLTRFVAAVEVPESLDADYADAGEPYGPGRRAALDWFAEHALAYHLEQTAGRTRIMHRNLADVQAMLKPA